MEGGTPVHVGREVLREEEDDDGKEERCPETRHVLRYPLAVGSDELPEDETNAEEETAHHLTVATLYEVDHLQTFPGLPGAEEEHEEADQIGR